MVIWLIDYPCKNLNNKCSETITGLLKMVSLANGEKHKELIFIRSCKLQYYRVLSFYNCSIQIKLN